MIYRPLELFEGEASGTAELRTGLAPRLTFNILECSFLVLIFPLSADAEILALWHLFVKLEHTKGALSSCLRAEITLLIGVYLIDISLKGFKRSHRIVRSAEKTKDRLIPELFTAMG